MNQLQSSTMFQKLPRMLRQRTTAQYKWQWDKENILDLLSERLRKVSNELKNINLESKNQIT